MENDITKKAKGVKTDVVKKFISIQDYRDSLLKEKLIYKKQILFRSIKHEIFTTEQNKLALSPFDDKRFLCNNKIDTLAWGHCKISEIISE